MQESKLYHIFVLKQYFENMYYPKEIISLIIMSDYAEPKIHCGIRHTIIVKDRLYICHTDKNQILDKKDIVEVISGSYQFIARTSVPNKLLVWGENQYGQLGLGDTFDRESFTNIELSNVIKSISCGVHHTLVLMTNGTIYSCGINRNGQLGLGNRENYITVLTKIDLSNIRYISCGANFSLAITEFGRCYLWGLGISGQLGLGDPYKEYSPQQLQLSNILIASCGTDYVLAITYDKTVYGWGANAYGELGLGYCKMRVLKPIKLELNNIISVKCANKYSMALTDTGKLYMWGYIEYEQVGSLNNKLIPQIVEFTKTIKSIYCNNNSSLVLTTTGKIYVRGENCYSNFGFYGETIPVHSELKF